MVLSAPQSANELDARRREKNPENVARIVFGISLLEQNPGQAELVLNGETEQLPFMQEAAQDGGHSDFYLVNSGDRGKSNTLTQFREFANSSRFEELTPTVIITSAYHIPRVARTAARHLPRGSFWVAGAPINMFAATGQHIIGEQKRILAYAPKDIDEDVPAGIVL